MYVTWFLSDPIAELKLPDISPQQLSTRALPGGQAPGVAADARLLHPVLGHPLPCLCLCVACLEEAERTCGKGAWRGSLCQTEALLSLLTLSLRIQNGEALFALLCHSVLPMPFTLVLWDHMDLSYFKQ